MSLEEYIIFVYCWVSENFNKAVQDSRLRKAGFPPKLSDVEVITMELVAEYLSIDSDKGIWEYFKNHWLQWFPQIGSRSQFAKQAANLYSVKQVLHTLMIEEIHLETVHIIDGFPIPICHLARSSWCKKFKGEASKGYCASKKEYYYGFKGHLLIDTNGVIVRMSITPANIDEREAFRDFSDQVIGLVLGDKGYIDSNLQQDLRSDFIDLQTPLRSNMIDLRPKKFVRELVSQRRLVETVISQLTEHFNITKVWARDMWHLSCRINRKIMANTIAVMANLWCNNKFIKLDALIQ